MPLRPIPFAAQSYQDRSLPVSSQRLVNMYLEEKPEGSKSRVALHNTPGLKPYKTIGTGPCRGMIVMGEDAWVVSGQTLYRIDRYDAVTSIGTVTGNYAVKMAHNGEDVVIASDFDAYYYDTVTSTYYDLSLDSINGLAFHDGYVIMSQKNTQHFYITPFVNEIEQSGNIDTSEFALANTFPDNIVTIENANRETWVFGETSIQIYYNSGAADFPFVRLGSGVIERGCVAKNSVKEYGGILYWLGDDRKVYRSRGQSYEAISTAPIEKELKTYRGLEDTTAIIYGDEGHLFYVLSFHDGTWCYDVSTGLWHERESGDLGRWRCVEYMRFEGKDIVGDYENGNLYELDLDTYDDNGTAIKREMIAPPIHANGSRLHMSSLVMDFEAGVGLTTGQGSEAEVMLDWSDDGGRTWSNEYWRSIGKVGEYEHRAKWTRLGTFRSRIYRVKISDPVKITAIEALGDAVARNQ